MSAAPARVAGTLHVVAGPMFAGKTQELLRRVRRAQAAARQVEVIGHRLDTRAGQERLLTHDGAGVAARMLGDAAAVRDLLRGRRPDLVAIDEAQFFGPELIGVVEELLVAGLPVHLAGLSVTFDGDPFTPMPELMAVADEVVKLTAVCSVCGADAPFHVRLTADVGRGLQVSARQVGGAESYQARCRAHRGPGPTGR